MDLSSQALPRYHRTSGKRPKGGTTVEPKRKPYFHRPSRGPLMPRKAVDTYPPFQEIFPVWHRFRASPKDPCTVWALIGRGKSPLYRRIPTGFRERFRGPPRSSILAYAGRVGPDERIELLARGCEGGRRESIVARHENVIGQ